LLLINKPKLITQHVGSSVTWQAGLLLIERLIKAG